MSKRGKYALIIASFGLFVLALLAAGCASAIKDLKVTENATGEAVSLGYKSATAYNQGEIDLLSMRAKSGDIDGSLAALAKHADTMAKVLKALDVASDLVDATDKLIGLVEAGIEKPSALIGQIPKLIQAGLDIKDALALLGVK